MYTLRIKKLWLSLIDQISTLKIKIHKLAHLIKREKYQHFWTNPKLRWWKCPHEIELAKLTLLGMEHFNRPISKEKYYQEITSEKGINTDGTIDSVADGITANSLRPSKIKLFQCFIDCCKTLRMKGKSCFYNANITLISTQEKDSATRKLQTNTTFKYWHERIKYKKKN